MEKFVENGKGIILFYFIIALLAFVCSWRLNTLSIVSQNSEVSKTKQCA